MMNSNLSFSIKKLLKSQFPLKNISIFTLIFCFHSIYAEETGLGKHAPSKPDVCKFVLESKEKHQTIDNFGASDGWSMQYIGFWPKAFEKGKLPSEISQLELKAFDPKVNGLNYEYFEGKWSKMPDF